MADDEVCGAEHPKQPGVYCTKKKPAVCPTHWHEEGTVITASWGEMLTSKKGGNKDRMVRIANSAQPENPVGPPPPVGEGTKAHGMALALMATPEAFREHFYDAAHEVARTQQTFTSDDVWIVLDRKGIDTEKRMGVGAMMQTLATRGWAEKTKERAVSSRPGSKERDGLTVWRSLVYEARPVAGLRDFD